MKLRFRGRCRAKTVGRSVAVVAVVAVTLQAMIQSEEHQKSEVVAV